MYKIIGADGNEYGPISADQLRQWIAEGRANAQTKVQPEGSTEWKTLGTLAEFADVFAAATAPPTVVAIDTQRWAEEVLARDYRIDIGNCISRGWELVKSDFWLLVGASAVAGVIAAGGFIPYLCVLIALILGGPMMGGLYALYLKRIRGQSASFGDAFLGFSVAFGSLLGTYLVSALLTCLGLLLCLVPGIYLGVSWVFALALVIDKKMDFWQAMELSRKVVTKHWWSMFGFLIVIGLLSLVGLLACCVGAFITTAIGEAALMYAYEDIFGAQRASIATRPVSIT
jgi:hypothetical protein